MCEDENYAELYVCYEPASQKESTELMDMIGHSPSIISSKLWVL